MPRLDQLRAINLKFYLKIMKILIFFTIEILIELTYALCCVGYLNSTLCHKVKLMLEKITFWLMSQYQIGREDFLPRQNMTNILLIYNYVKTESLLGLIKLDFEFVLVLVILVRWYLLIFNVKKILNEFSLYKVRKSQKPFFKSIHFPKKTLKLKIFSLKKKRFRTLLFKVMVEKLKPKKVSCYGLTKI